ncbi:MAG: hypothetical protein KDA93_07195 [Planctomycetaceae bacterium]|nr:hypothetical protein [Planctomycetaceae bacterium]
MTEQISDRLDNRHPRVKFGDLDPTRVARSNPQRLLSLHLDYRFQTKPVPHPLGTWCYRGYVAEFELTPEGTLVLKSYSYPTSLGMRNTKRTAVNEPLVGNFWLVMNSHFYGPEVYVPFREGKIVENESEWGVERGFPLADVRYPERYEHYIKEMPKPLVLGRVVNAHFDYEGDCFIVNCTHEFPLIYPRANLVRQGEVVCEIDIFGSSSCGGLFVESPTDATIMAGDVILATGKTGRKLLAKGEPR